MPWDFISHLVKRRTLDYAIDCFKFNFRSFYQIGIARPIASFYSFVHIRHQTANPITYLFFFNAFLFPLISNGYNK